MKHFILLTALLFTETAFAVCASPISRTNVGANNVLTSTKYNTDVNTAYNKINNLPGDCITDASINGGKLIDASVTGTKLIDGTIATAKIADGAITAAKLAAAIENLVPVGTILTYAGATAPSGYLLGHGQSLSRTTYATLFGVIGTAYGTADGNSFNIPDCRGRFTRFVDGGVGRDPDRAGRTAMATGGNTGDAVGSVQSDQLGSHSHFTVVNVSTTNIDPLNTSNSVTKASTNGGYGLSGTLDNQIANIGLTSATGGSESRPENFNANCIIKY